METSRPIFPALGPVTLPRRSRDLEFSAYVLTLEYRFNVSTAAHSVKNKGFLVCQCGN
jgi:hypothetical protein